MFAEASAKAVLNNSGINFAAKFQAGAAAKIDGSAFIRFGLFTFRVKGAAHAGFYYSAGFEFKAGWTGNEYTFVYNVDAGAGIGFSHTIACPYHNLPFTWHTVEEQCKMWEKSFAQAMKAWVEELVTGKAAMAKLAEVEATARASSAAFDPKATIQKLAEEEEERARALATPRWR